MTFHLLNISILSWCCIITFAMILGIGYVLVNSTLLAIIIMAYRLCPNEGSRGESWTQQHNTATLDTATRRRLLKEKLLREQVPTRTHGDTSTKPKHRVGALHCCERCPICLENLDEEEDGRTVTVNGGDLGKNNDRSNDNSNWMGPVCRSTNPRCQHAFHADCIVEWLLRDESCPCCRQQFMAPPTLPRDAKVKVNDTRHAHPVPIEFFADAPFWFLFCLGM